ncbi:MAG: GTP-binding protein [Anaerolineae bacterium]
MLAGVGGIDAAILVIAADEGVMPQTREHLAILDLLGVAHRLVALTKIDLIDDPGVELVSDEIRAALASTALAGAGFCPCPPSPATESTRTIDHLAEPARRHPPRPEYGVPRLPIDRVFTISGFGTVVTRTLPGRGAAPRRRGRASPSGLRGRMRGLQSYKQSVESRPSASSRVAVNIAGVERQAVARGDDANASRRASADEIDRRAVSLSRRHGPTAAAQCRRQDFQRRNGSGRARPADRRRKPRAGAGKLASASARPPAGDGARRPFHRADSVARTDHRRRRDRRPAPAAPLETDAAECDRGAGTQAARHARRAGRAGGVSALPTERSGGGGQGCRYRRSGGAGFGLAGGAARRDVSIERGRAGNPATDDTRT